MDEEEVCTCGHAAADHEGESGACHVDGCPCEAYTEDVDDPATVQEAA
jgi:hypothetical protein